MMDAPWKPRSAFDRLHGCVFLPRIIDKARRATSGLPIGEYMYGDNDYMDSRVLRFFEVKAAELSDLVCKHADDEAVARAVIDRTNKSERQIAGFNRRMLVMYGIFFAMFDADEGRASGPLAKALAGFYNAVIYPPFAMKFRHDEARSPRA